MYNGVWSCVWTIDDRRIDKKMGDYHFDAAKARDGLVQAVKDLAAAQGFDRVVIGISGGKDSTVSAAICARALGKDHVYGVMIPRTSQTL